MAKQLITVLCEGPHDIAYLTRILKTTGFTSNEKTKIGDYPIPINRLFLGEIEKTNVEDLNFQEVRQSFLPTQVIKRDDIHIFLYSAGSDSKIISKVNYILSKFLLLSSEESGEISRLPQDTNLSLLCFLDADKKGVTSRLTELNSGMENQLQEKPFSKHQDIVKLKNIKLGNFIFTGNDNNTGKLEDILLPLMKTNNEQIFENTQKYFDDNHEASRIFPLKLSIENDVLIEKRSIKPKDTDFDALKSLIGLTGQLQRSGKPNTVYITESDYLTLDKISTNTKCLEIIKYFGDFISFQS